MVQAPQRRGDDRIHCGKSDKNQTFHSGQISRPDKNRQRISVCHANSSERLDSTAFPPSFLTNYFWLAALVPSRANRRRPDPLTHFKSSSAEFTRCRWILPWGEWRTKRRPIFRREIGRGFRHEFCPVEQGHNTAPISHKYKRACSTVSIVLSS